MLKIRSQLFLLRKKQVLQNEVETCPGKKEIERSRRGGSTPGNIVHGRLKRIFLHVSTIDF
jgi:hypothetical protein